MEPGERDRLVTIEQLTDGIGASGFPTETWTTLAPMYAGRYEERGTERFHAQQLSAVSIVRWETGYRADCDPELVDVPKTRRINYQGRIFDVLESSLIGRREGIEFMTRAKSAVSA